MGPVHICDGTYPMTRPGDPQLRVRKDDDPTHGYVDYQSQASAASTQLGGQLIYTYPNGSNYMGVDYWNSYPVEQTASMRGRPSVRIESKKQYTYGLFVADIARKDTRAAAPLLSQNLHELQSNVAIKKCTAIHKPCLGTLEIMSFKYGDADSSISYRYAREYLWYLASFVRMAFRPDDEHCG